MEEDPFSNCGSDSVCKVGTLLSSSCSDESLTTKKDLFIIKEKLDDEQLELLIWRTGFQNYDKEDTICSHHLYYYLTYFEQRQKSCCDPYKRHLKLIINKKNLRKITLEKAKDYKEKKNIHLIPGHLLCSNCRKILSNESEEKEDERNPGNDEDTDFDKNFDLTLGARLTEKDKMNKSLIEMEVSPIKLQSVSSHSKKPYAKRKLKQIESQMKKKLSLVLNVDEEESGETESDTEKRKNSEEVKRKCDDIDKLVELMKEKLNSNLTKREKIQVLTIAP